MGSTYARARIQQQQKKPRCQKECSTATTFARVRDFSVWRSSRSDRKTYIRAHARTGLCNAFVSRTGENVTPYGRHRVRTTRYDERTNSPDVEDQLTVPNGKLSISSFGSVITSYGRCTDRDKISLFKSDYAYCVMIGPAFRVYSPFKLTNWFPILYFYGSGSTWTSAHLF
jgi:hypothetical protein